MKMIFIAFEIEQDGKYYAVAETFQVGEDIVFHCKQRNAKIGRICESRREADQIAIALNKSYKQNGTSIFL